MNICFGARAAATGSGLRLSDGDSDTLAGPRRPGPWLPILVTGWPFKLNGPRPVLAPGLHRASDWQAQAGRLSLRLSESQASVT
jgi:hypothetical protein